MLDKLSSQAQKKIIFDLDKYQEDKYIYVNELLGSFIKTGTHPCLGARSVMNNNTYSFEIFNKLGDENSANKTCESVYNYLQERPDNSYPKLYSFFAIYEMSSFESELEFEKKLWEHLNFMHKYDKKKYDWDSMMSSDPNDVNFGFSIGGKAFYIVGMHPNSNRNSRSFPMVMLVFNLHEQFELLKEKGSYYRLRESIRNRDKNINGSINPMMITDDTESEVKQYSGRQVGKDWKCPFST